MLVHSLFDFFRIRVADATDLYAVINLWQQLSGLTLRAEDSPEILQAALDQGALHLYVAECEAEIVGTIMVGIDGRRGHLYHLAVVERKQGVGIGRRLVEFALEELAACGISRAHVFAQIDNENAHGFWAHLGWQQRTDLVVFSQVAKEPSDAR